MPSPKTVKDNFSLNQNSPNPFNKVTNISFSLPEPVEVKLTVTNLRNELVKILLQKKLEAGEQTVKWDSTNSAGKKVNSGGYNYKMEVESHSFISVRRMSKRNE